MTQVYSDPSRENEPYALPDVEVFYAEAGELKWEGQEEPSEAGWYFWLCFPGCLPDSDPIGPFQNEADAAESAQSQSWC